MKQVFPKFERPIVPGIDVVLTGGGRAKIVVSGIDLGDSGFIDNDSMLGPSLGLLGSPKAAIV